MPTKNKKMSLEQKRLGTTALEEWMLFGQIYRHIYMGKYMGEFIWANIYAIYGQVNMNIFPRFQLLYKNL